MAATNERFPFPGRVWFDANNPETLHDALRADYAATRSEALTRPSLRRHMESCAECQSIRGGTTAAPSPLSTRKRLKLALTKELMHRALRLPENFEIVHMYAENDPNVVFVLVAGEGLPEADPNQPTPIGRLDETGGTTDRAS